MKILKESYAKETLGLAGVGIGLGVIGDAFGSTGLQQAGSVTTGFVPIAANLGMANVTIKMLKDLRR